MRRRTLLAGALLPVAAHAAVLVNGSGKVQLNSAGHPIIVGGSGGGSGATSLTLTDVPQGTVYSRAANSATTGPVPVAFAYTGTLNAPRGKVVSYQTGATVFDFPLTINSSNGSTALATLPSVPIGDDYTLTIYDGAVSSVGTHRWGVGVVGVWAGQSNLTTDLNGGSYDGYTIAGGSGNTERQQYFSGAPGVMPSFRILDSTGFHRPTNGSSFGGAADGVLSYATQGYNSLTSNVFAFGRMLGASLSALYGRTIPVAMAISQADSTTITAWLSGGAHVSDLTALPDHEFFMWRQGEADTGQGTTWYAGKLALLHQQMLAQVSPFGRAASGYKFLVGTLSQMSAPDQTQTIRTAQLQMAASETTAGRAGAQVGWSNTDLPSDGLHVTGTDAQRASMRRMIRSAEWVAGTAPCSGRGPVITGLISRTGQVCKLAVAHESGSTATALQSLTTGTPSGFTCSSDGFMSSIALPAAVSIVSATEIDVTLPSGMTGSAAIHYQAGIPGASNFSGQSYDGSATVDTSNPIYDNLSLPEPMASDASAYAGMGLPLLPTATAISV